MKRKITISCLAVIFIVLSVVITVNKNLHADGLKRIGIATLMNHPALDAVKKNIKLELESQGYIENKNIIYEMRNANGQIQLTSNIAWDLSTKNLDIIVAITTPMAQAVVKVARCPVVFAAVTDPVGAGIVKSLDKGETNITGTSDAWPYEGQLKLIRKISPFAKKLGVIYNPGESASQYGIKKIRKFAPKYGFELLEGSANTTNEVYPVAQSIVRRVDALFLSSDNTVIAGAAAAIKVAVEFQVPLYVGDSGTVEKGGLAAVSVGYSELGRQTGKLIVRTLKGEKNIPTFVSKGDEVYINKKAAELMGVKISDKILKSATKVYEEINQ